MGKKNPKNDFLRPTFWLNPREYAKICSEINALYDVQFKNQKIAAHTSFGIDGVAYIYWFENHGFNNYNFFLRTIDEH